MDQQATSPSIIEKASEHNGPVGAFRLRHVDNPEPCFGRALTRKRQRIYVRQDTCVDSGSDIHTDHHRCLRPGGRRPNWQLLLGGKSPGRVGVPNRTAVEAHHLVRPPIPATPCHWRWSKPRVGAHALGCRGQIDAQNQKWHSPVEAQVSNWPQAPRKTARCQSHSNTVNMPLTN
jgi:hypothetical protein